MKRTHIKFFIPLLICLFVFQSVAFAFQDLPFVTYASSIEPYEIAVDSIGYVYASVPTSPPQEILQFDEAGPIGPVFDCLKVLDLAVDHIDGYIYILYEDYDTFKKVAKLDPSSSPISIEDWPLFLSNPAGIAVGMDGSVFIAEDSTNQLMQFDSFGSPISIVSIPMPDIDGIAAGPNYLYVFNSNEVHIFTYDFTDLNTPIFVATAISSIATDSDGFLYIAESSLLSKFAPDGTLFGTFSYPFTGIHDIAIGADDMIYVTELNHILKSQPSSDPGFTVTETGGNTIVSEAGTTDTFTIVLDTAPSSDVILNVTIDDTDEATVDYSTLTFTSSNWGIPQTVTVTGIDDDIDDGDQTIPITVSVNDGASDDAFDLLADQTVSATTTDDDTAGFTLSTATVTVAESATTDTFTVVLDCEPTSDVVLNVTSEDTDEATVAPATLTFTPGNWSSTQTITVTGVDDDIDDGDQTIPITVSVNDGASDDAFDLLAEQTVSATTTDDDTAGFTLSTATVTVAESATTDTFTVVLDCEPTSDVVLNVTSEDTDEATVAPATLTFTPGNWSSTQTITVTGVDDDIDDGDQTIPITVSVNDGASDDAFDLLAEQTVSATTTDDDTAGFTLSTATVTVAESATTETFTVVLDCEPTSDVVLNVTSGDISEATVDYSTLTFTSSNWGIPQTITVTGVDDDIDDGDQTIPITVSVNDGASDDAFDLLANQTVSATTTDDDTVGFTLSNTSVTVEESGTTDTFTIVLNTKPTNPVYLDLTNPDPTEATVSPHHASFTEANWDTPQIFTVTGVDDTDVDGDQTYQIVIEVAIESSVEYLTVSDQFVSITTINDDVAVPIESIALDHSELVISEGYPATLTATVSPADATEPVTLKWFSSDPGGVLIDLVDNLDGTATIEAIYGAEGDVVVTAEASNTYGSAAADCPVAVLSPIDYLLYSIDQCVCEGSLIANGDEEKLVAFISSVEEVKMLIEDQDYLAAQSKLDEIYAKIDGMSSPKDFVIADPDTNLAQMILDLRDRIVVPVTGVHLNHTDLLMTVKDVEALIATIEPSNAATQELIWTTSDKNVVRVNAEGILTAKKAGTATITVTTVDGGYTATCTVIVINP